MLRSIVNDFPVRRIMFVSLIMVFELNYPDLIKNEYCEMDDVVLHL